MSESQNQSPTWPWNSINYQEHSAIAPTGNRIVWTRQAAQIANCERTLVCFHGVLRNWRSFYPLFSDVRHFANVVSIDFRGHGRSSSVANGYRVTDYVTDAVNVLNQLDGKLVVYGHSLGAMVALAACEHLQARIELAVLEDPPFDTMGSNLPGTPLMRYFEGVQQCLLSVAPPNSPRLEEPLKNLEPSPASRTEQPNIRVRQLFEAFSDLVIGQHSDGTPKRIRDDRDLASRWFTAESLAQLDPQVLQPITAGTWLAGYNLDNLLATSSFRVHLLQADPNCGGMLTNHDAAYFCGKLGKRCTLTTFPNVGHSIHWSQPASVVKLLAREFAS